MTTPSGIEPYDSSLVLLVVVGFMVAFVLAFGIGANDVANSFGTSVGAGVLTIFQACVLATIFEIAGAVLIGYKVSDTMRKGILDVSLYEGHERELMLGSLASLVGSAVWLLIATAFKMPISGTHSIVGATVGFSLVCRGTAGVRWMALLNIVASWFASPLLSGIVSVSIFSAIRSVVLRSTKPLDKGLNMLPLAYGLTVAVNVLSIAHDGPKLLKLDRVPTWASVAASFVVGLVTAVVVYVFLVPWQRRRIILTHRVQNGLGPTPGVDHSNHINNNNHSSNNNNTKESTALAVLGPGGDLDVQHSVAPSKTMTSATTHLGPPMGSLRPNTSASPLLVAAAGEGGIETGEPLDEEGLMDQEHPDVSKLFAFLQVLTAAFGSFAHGGNDVSNAIGPLIALWAIFAEGSARQEAETPLAILLYGGLGIATGLWLWGRRVIETLGKDLASITPTTGFAIEVGAAVTVLLASKAGLPVSTTHCKVGSVVCVGWASRGARGVSWSLFRNIAFAWVITVPVAGLLSAACMFAFRQVLKV